MNKNSQSAVIYEPIRQHIDSSYQSKQLEKTTELRVDEVIQIAQKNYETNHIENQEEDDSFDITIPQIILCIVACVLYMYGPTILRAIFLGK